MDRQGREALLATWLSRHGDDIARVCFSILGDAALSQDAAQDAFLKAWRHMDSCLRRGGEGEKTWLMRIAVNTCRDYRRSAWFRRVNRAITPEQLPERASDERDEGAALWMTVDALPAKYREVLLLYYGQALTYEEIARVLAVSVSTVARRLDKALDALKRAIEEDETDV